MIGEKEINLIVFYSSYKYLVGLRINHHFQADGKNVFRFFYTKMTRNGLSNHERLLWLGDSQIKAIGDIFEKDITETL